jgi:hypothetical protein
LNPVVGAGEGTGAGVGDGPGGIGFVDSAKVGVPLALATSALGTGWLLAFS